MPYLFTRVRGRSNGRVFNHKRDGRKMECIHTLGPVQTLCAIGKIEGAIKFGRDWAVPKDAERPDDSRVKSGKYKGWRDKKNSSERMG